MSATVEPANKSRPRRWLAFLDCAAVDDAMGASTNTTAHVPRVNEVNREVRLIHVVGPQRDSHQSLNLVHSSHQDMMAFTGMQVTRDIRFLPVRRTASPAGLVRCRVISVRTFFRPCYLSYEIRWPSFRSHRNLRWIRDQRNTNRELLRIGVVYKYLLSRYASPLVSFLVLTKTRLAFDRTTPPQIVNAFRRSSNGRPSSASGAEDHRRAPSVLMQRPNTA